MITFSNKVYIITGAASGIGRETSRVLAEQGATVIMMDVNTDGLAESASICGKRCHPMTIDLTDASAVAVAVSKIVEQ